MMKCMIVRNEGIYILLLVYFTAVSSSFVAETSQTIQALCSNNRYIYRFQPGESHELKLRSVNTTGGVNKWYQKSKRKCWKEFKTNNGASHFIIKVSNMSVPSCSEICHCNYFEITESGHPEKFCGKRKDDIYFESKTDYLSIQFQHGLSMDFDVTLTFSVQRNTYVISGIPKEDLTSGHFLETPFFPKLFPSDYVAEYILQSDDLSGHVMLMFLDFQLAPDSYIEVLGHNNTHPVRFFGDVFRPPVLISESNQLNLKFEANNQVAAGFRAVCFFLNGPDVNANRPFTNCGGAKDGYSGVVSIERSGKHEYYDCLWRLSTPVFSHDKSNFLSVSNITLENMGPKATLEFREGTNSKSDLLKTVICTDYNCSTIPSEIVIPASSGLYIRFNGLLNPDSIVKMVYSTYHNGNCDDKDLICNERCLLPSLRCDGVKNCPDGSDERECTVTTAVAIAVTFPPVIKKKSHSSATETSFIVVLSFGVCGLIVVFLVIFFAFYRHFKVAPNQPEQDSLPQVREMSTTPLPRTCQRSSTYYDQPPSYDDFIRTSEQYPPLLYTRAAKRHSEPHNALYTSQHTTSFTKQPASHSVDLHSLYSVDRNSDSGDLSLVYKCNSVKNPASHSVDLSSVYDCRSDVLNSGSDPIFSEPSCSFNQSNAEWSFKELFLSSSPSGLKKTTSLDSVFDKGSDCHVQVSITHSVRPRCHLNKFHSLPTRFKITELKRNEIDITFLTTLPDSSCRKKRKFSSCLVCRDSGFNSELTTTIKARCHSDPCRRVSLYYSLRH